MLLLTPNSATIHLCNIGGEMLPVVVIVLSIMRSLMVDVWELIVQ